MGLSWSHKSILKLSWYRIIAFLIGNHQFSICRPYLVSTLLNRLSFYLVLLLCMVIYLSPHQVFVKTTFELHLTRFFYAITLLQALLLVIGFSCCGILHMALRKGNSQYPAATVKRLVIYTMVSISLNYSWGAIFLITKDVYYGQYVLLCFDVIVMTFSILYYWIFSYIFTFYASTTLILNGKQYFLASTVPHIMAFIFGPCYFAFLRLTTNLANWLITSKVLHLSLLSFAIYHIVIYSKLPFCAMMTSMIIFFSSIISGINVMGLLATMALVPAKRFSIFINTLMCWTIIMFSICFALVTRKYRREQAAIVRLHNGVYHYTTTYFTPETLYNNLLIFISYTKRSSVMDKKRCIALENICLCYVIALFKSLEYDSYILRRSKAKQASTARKSKAHQKCIDQNQACVEAQKLKSCISRCSRQKRFAYICLILDLIEVEVSQVSRDMWDINLHHGVSGTNTADHQEKRTIYEVNLYFLETFASLEIIKSMDYLLNNSKTTRKKQSHEYQKQHNLKGYITPTTSTNRSDELVTSSLLLEAIQYYPKERFDLLETVTQHNTNGGDTRYADLMAPIRSEQGGHNHAFERTYRSTEKQLDAAAKLGKPNRPMHKSSSSIFSYSPIEEKPALPLRVYRYSNERMTMQPASRRNLRTLWMDWFFSSARASRAIKASHVNVEQASVNHNTEFRRILRNLSPSFILDVVLMPSLHDQNNKRPHSINKLLAFLLYSCCGSILVAVGSKKAGNFQLKQIFDPCKLFYLDDSAPQTLYKEPQISTSRNTSSAEKSVLHTNQSVVVASPMAAQSGTKLVNSIFDEHLNPGVTPLETKKSAAKSKQRMPHYLSSFRLPNMLVFGDLSGESANLQKFANDTLHGFMPPSKYQYFVNPRLENTRPMNLCACTIINSILSRILEDADTCLKNIARIAKLSNNLKQDSNFSNARLEELMVLCAKQNLMYQDMVEQAKKLYRMYPQCITATHTLAWVYHELYNSIWPLNQLSIFPLIDHIDPSLAGWELSRLHKSFVVPTLQKEKKHSTFRVSVDSEDIYNDSSDSPEDSLGELSVAYTRTNDSPTQYGKYTTLALSIMQKSEQMNVSKLQDPASTTLAYQASSTTYVSLPEFGQTGSKSTIMTDFMYNPGVFPLQTSENDGNLLSHVHNFISSQELSTKSFYIAHNADGAIVILPPCLSYCHYAVIDGPSALQRCDYKTYNDIIRATSQWGSQDIPINILDQATILSAVQNKLTNKEFQSGPAKLRTFFTTGFSASLKDAKTVARQFVTKLLNKHQDIIRATSIFTLKNTIYILIAIVAFTLSLIIISKSEYIFSQNETILRSVESFMALVQAQQLNFTRIYNNFTDRKVSGVPKNKLFTVEELNELYKISTSTQYIELSQHIYDLRLSLEQYTFTAIHPFFHVLPTSNRTASFTPGPIPERMYGTLIFQNPYIAISYCFTNHNLTTAVDLGELEDFEILVDCMHRRIEEAHSDAYIAILPLMWSTIFTTATTSLVVQNFFTHFRVILVILTAVMGIGLTFAFSSYNVFMLRLQNLCDLLLNLLARTGARFNYRLLFAQFYLKARLTFRRQNVRHIPLYEQLMALHPDIVNDGIADSSSFEADSSKSGAEPPFGPPAVPSFVATPTQLCPSTQCILQYAPLGYLDLANAPIPGDNTDLQLAEVEDVAPNSETQTGSSGEMYRYSPSNDTSTPIMYSSNNTSPISVGNFSGKASHKYEYNRLVSIYKQFSEQFTISSTSLLISRLFIMFCIALSLAMLYIFHSLPIVSYTDTGLGPYYAMVINNMRYTNRHPVFAFDQDEEDEYLDIPLEPGGTNILGLVRCLKRATTSKDREECKDLHSYFDSKSIIKYASPQWRLTWIRENYALLQDLILDTFLTDLSISRHESLTPGLPGTRPYEVYKTCSRAILNPHLAPFDLDSDIRLEEIVKRLIYLYTMSLRGPTYDYYSMILTQYGEIIGKYTKFVSDYSTASSSSTMFEESKHKAALLIPPTAATLPQFNKHDLQKTTLGISAFLNLQKNIYDGFSILQPSYTELTGENSCSEILASHSLLLLSSLTDQRNSTSTNKDVDTESITQEHVWSIMLLFGIIPISLLLVHYRRVLRLKFFKIKNLVWVDLYSYKILSTTIVVTVSTLTCVIGATIILCYTKFITKQLAVKHMTAVYLSSSRLNNLGLQILDSLSQYNMQLANLEWSVKDNAYKYKCEDVYSALQKPIMLNTRFKLAKAITNISVFLDEDEVLKPYYELRHALFSVNIALARMCKLPAEFFPESSDPNEYGADVYLDQVFKFSAPQPNVKYSLYYDDFALCIDTAHCVDIYSYNKLRTLTDDKLHEYIKYMSSKSDIIIKKYLQFSHVIEFTTTDLTKHILSVEYRIDDFITLTQQAILWLLSILVALATLVYVCLQASAALNGLIAFKLVTTHQFSLAFRFGITVGLFAAIVAVFILVLLLTFFRTHIFGVYRSRTESGTSVVTKPSMTYQQPRDVILNCYLLKTVIITMKGIDLTYDKMQISDLYLRIQIIKEYAKVAHSSASVLLSGFMYTNSTGSYDIKDLILRYTVNVLQAVDRASEDLRTKAVKFGQWISLSEIYPKDDYFGLALLTVEELSDILSSYMAPTFETANIRYLIILVYTTMIGVFVSGLIYIFVAIKRKISSILTVLHTIPVADLFSFNEMSSGIFAQYGDILSFTKLR